MKSNPKTFSHHKRKRDETRRGSLINTSHIKEQKCNMFSISKLLKSTKHMNEFIYDIIYKLNRLYNAISKEKAEIVLNQIKVIFNSFSFDYSRYYDNNNDILIHPFNQSITSHHFLRLFCAAVNCRIISFEFNPKNNLEQIRQYKIKEFLEKYIEASNNIIKDIPFLTDSPLGRARQDYLLTVLMTTKSKLNISSELFTSDYCLPFFLNQIEENKFLKEKNDNDIPSKKIRQRAFIKTIVLQPIILELYKEVLAIQGKKVSIEDIKQKLEPFIDSMKLYALYCNEYGFTIADGTIFMRMAFYEEGPKKYGTAGCFIFTLIHELGHVVNRLFRDDTNFFILTDRMISTENGILIKESESKEEIIKKAEPNSDNILIEMNTNRNTKDDHSSEKTKIIDDFGDAVEKLLYLSHVKSKHIGYYGGKYLLNINNYLKPKKQFINELATEIDKVNPDANENDIYLFGKSSRDYIAFPHCLWSSK